MLIAREVVIASHAGMEVLMPAYSCLPSRFFTGFLNSNIMRFSSLIPQVAIVVGGRNFFCGDTWVNSTGLDRTTAYQIG